LVKERFKRGLDGGDPTNAALNYGGGTLRAIVARTVVAFGLCRRSGFFTGTNPTRARWSTLERAVSPGRRPTRARLRDEKRLGDGLSTETKLALIRRLTRCCNVEGLQETISEAASKAPESLARVFVGKDKRLTLPDALPLAAQPGNADAENGKRRARRRGEG
jgi:hypothetical protein